MILYCNTAIIGMIVAGLCCLVIGVLSLIKGYKKDENGKINKEKVFSGWRLSVLGTIILTAFIALLIVVVPFETNEGEAFLTSSWFFMFFFFPLVFALCFVFFLFFLIMGTISLRDGYTSKKEGKFADKEKIVLGYLMIVLGIIVVASTLLFIFSVLLRFKLFPDNRTSSLSSSALSNFLIAKLL